MSSCRLSLLLLLMEVCAGLATLSGCTASRSKEWNAVHDVRAFGGQSAAGSKLIDLAVYINDDLYSRWLIDNGADPSERWGAHGGFFIQRLDVSSFTPLHIAAYNGNANMVRLLIASDAELDSKTEICATPLSICLTERSGAWKEVVEILLNAGANPNASLPEYSSLHLSKPDIDIARTLIDHGANIEARNNFGDTPLIFALRAPSNEAFANELIKAGANVSVENFFGLGPLDYAELQGYVDVERRLREKGAVHGSHRAQFPDRIDRAEIKP